jgi:integrase
MATLGRETYKREDGSTSTTYRVLFVDPAGRRQTIRLGKVPKKVAESAKLKIESLLAARIAGHPLDAQTAGWLGQVGDAIHERLEKAGLVEPRQKEAAVAWTLGSFLESYFATLGGQKRMTALNYGRARRLLEEFFGTGRRLDSIHAGDADEYRTWLLAPTKSRKAFALASASVDLRRARQFFKAAVRRRLVAENPFADVRCAAQANPTRSHFVSQETIEAVIAACPNHDWRLIFALARYAGLRIPSELDELKWSDVNWERGRITVHVPKKAHLSGHETRIVPIFAELRPHLEAAFEAAEPGAVYVVPRARGGRNLRRYAEQLLDRAGVAKWPKLFHNLRASRETELLAIHPAHVVFSWIGHTAAVARSHYLQVTDSDFDRASNPAQNPAQSGAATGRLTPTGLRETREKTRVGRKRGKSQVPSTGIEQTAKRPAKRPAGDPPGTESGTVPAGDVAELVRLLASLTPEERASLLALAREAGVGQRQPSASAQPRFPRVPRGSADGVGGPRR